MGKCPLLVLRGHERGGRPLVATQAACLFDLEAEFFHKVAPLLFFPVDIGRVFGRRMSAFGPKQTCAVQLGMSALGQ